MRFEVRSADLTADSTRFQIIECLDDREIEFSGSSDTSTGSADFENLYDFTGVLEIRSEEHRTSRVKRLDQVVATDRSERSAYEGNRGGGIHRSQLTQ